MPTAFLFPGQGSHAPAMRSLADAFAPELTEIVLTETHGDAFARAGEGTAFAQPAIVCASLAQWTGAGRPSVEFFAGHSLGELSALAAAGSLDPADAVRLAVVRGSLMEAAARETPGAMVALLGDSAQARAAAAESGLEIANDNGPTQIVAAGSPDAIEVVMRKAKARGVRAMELPVSGAFHTQAMAPALEPFREALEDVQIERPTTPVHSCSTTKPFGDDPADIRDQLAWALVRPVRWRETIDSLIAAGATEFVEAGPGKALVRMLKRSHPDVDSHVLGEAQRGLTHV